MREPSQSLPPTPADARFGPLRLARYEKEDGRALILYSRGTDGEAPGDGAAGEGEPDDGKLDDGEPDDGKLDDGKPDDGKPDDREPDDPEPGSEEPV